MFLSLGDKAPYWRNIILSCLKFYRNSGPINNMAYAIVAPVLKSVLGLNLRPGGIILTKVLVF